MKSSLSYEEACWVTDRWRLDYNHHRIHSSLDYQTPAAYAARCVLPASATPQPPKHSSFTLTPILSLNLVQRLGGSQQCSCHSAVVTVQLSQCSCHSAVVTVQLSQCSCHSAVVTVQLSQCSCHSAVVTVQLSQCSCHSAVVTVQLSQCSCHSAVVTVQLSQCSCHSAVVTVQLSQCSCYSARHHDWHPTASRRWFSGLWRES